MDSPPEPNHLPLTSANNQKQRTTKKPRKPTAHEDLVDGFAFLAFKTFDDLNRGTGGEEKGCCVQVLKTKKSSNEKGHKETSAKTHAPLKKKHKKKKLMDQENGEGSGGAGGSGEPPASATAPTTTSSSTTANNLTDSSSGVEGVVVEAPKQPPPLKTNRLFNPQSPPKKAASYCHTPSEDPPAPADGFVGVEEGDALERREKPPKKLRKISSDSAPTTSTANCSKRTPPTQTPTPTRTPPLTSPRSSSAEGGVSREHWRRKEEPPEEELLDICSSDTDDDRPFTPKDIDDIERLTHQPPVSLLTSGEFEWGKEDPPYTLHTIEALTQRKDALRRPFPPTKRPFSKVTPATTAGPAASSTKSSGLFGSIARLLDSSSPSSSSNRSSPAAPPPHSPRGHSPSRERDSYSSTVSSLSRATGTPLSSNSALPPPPPPTLSPHLSYSKAASWLSSVPLPPPRPTPPPPAPQPPPPASSSSSSSSSAGPPNHHHHPHHHLSPYAPPPNMFVPPILPYPPPPHSSASYASLFTPPSSSALTSFPHHPPHPPPTNELTRRDYHFPPPTSGVVPPFPQHHPMMGLYRGGGMGPFMNGLPPAPPPTSFVPPTQPPSFALKKTGKWNAMHVRITWEIYQHQQKLSAPPSAAPKPPPDLFRPPLYTPLPPFFLSPHHHPPPHPSSVGARYGAFGGLGASFGAQPPPPPDPYARMGPMGRGGGVAYEGNSSSPFRERSPLRFPEEHKEKSPSERSRLEGGGGSGSAYVMYRERLPPTSSSQSNGGPPHHFHRPP